MCCPSPKSILVEKKSQPDQGIQRDTKMLFRSISYLLWDVVFTNNLIHLGKGCMKP